MSKQLISALDLFKSTLDQLNLQQHELLSVNAEGGGQLFIELAEQLCESWHILAEQLAEIGTPALMDLIALYAENLDFLLASTEDGLSGPGRELLQNWQHACSRYLQSPADVNGITAWVALLTNPLWHTPLHEDDATELSDGLIDFASCLPGIPESIGTSPTSPSQETATPKVELQADDEWDIEIESLADRPVKPVDLALVQMIGDEFGKIADDLTQTLAKFNFASQDEYQESLSANNFLLENINKACETVGLFGLSYVFRWLWLNVVSKAAANLNYDEECNLFGIALILIREYLHDITNGKHSADLVRHLQQSGWRKPLPEPIIPRLLETLNVPIVDSDAQRANLERTVAKPKDVSLTIPDDVDSDLLQALLHEIPVLTENFSAAIQEIIGSNASQTKLLEAQRIAHTLKGACNTIGVRGIANLTHSLEAILEALNTEQVLPGRKLGSLLLDAADCLGTMSDFLQGQGEAPEQPLAMLQQVLDWDFRIKKQGVIAAEASDDVMPSNLPAETASETNGNDDVRAKTPKPMPSIMLDEIIEVAAEGSSLGERAHEKFGDLLSDSHEVREMTWRLSELVAEMDRLVNIQSITGRDSMGDQSFDALEMEQYSELHTCLSRLAEVAADMRVQNAQMHRQLLDGKNLLIEQRNVQKTHMDHIQNLRLVPVQRIVSRCQRIVRQTAGMTGKQVDLQISGENTLIDSDILNGLSEALMHLLRNAVDHGIETPEYRKSIGKPQQGVIRLSFTNDRNAINISCQDDGSGLDNSKILSTARDKGLISDQQTLSIEQIHRLIFRPGFSTKDMASQVSGRGIGMDVIQTQIARMNGVMDLASSPDRGLTVNINVPSNLYDAPMVLVKIGGQTFAVSERGIQQIFCALDGTLSTAGDGSFHYRIENNLYAADTLDNLLGLGLENRAPETPAGLLFKGQHGGEQVVLVDQVIGYKNLMIRPFGDYLKGVYGVLGCVILGSGQIAPVIDLFELISDTERRTQVRHDMSLTPVKRRIAKTQVLVVDDSLSSRKAVVQLLADFGYEVQTAIDGLDAIDKIEVQIPDIIISDLEMPRMNGIELTRYLRATADLQDIPLVMITSRSTDKHRTQAASAGVTLYLTKPFNDEDLIIKINTLLHERLAPAA
jgi:chemosensory pili system protein ChpA (sensor histidine kinase/response regulator)